MTTPKSWRDVLPIHPACAAFPDMSHDKLVELGEDIKVNGLKEDVHIHDDGKNKYSLLDGKNRLSAMELVGIKFDFKIKWSGGPRSRTAEPQFRVEGRKRVALYKFGSDPLGPQKHVISVNVHRRHLTPEQKRQITESLLKLDPSLSNREIAKTVNVDHKTVGKVRDEMEGRGEIPHVEARKDSRGRAQPARKAKVSARAEPAKSKESVKKSVSAKCPEAGKIDEAQLDIVPKQAEPGETKVEPKDELVEEFCQQWVRSPLKQVFEQADNNQRAKIIGFITRGEGNKTSEAA